MVSDPKIAEIRSKSSTLTGNALIMDERNYLICVPSETVPSQIHLSDAEQQTVLDYRWWSLPELESTEDVVAPLQLSHYLKPVLNGNILDHPLTLPTQ